MRIGVFAPVSVFSSLTVSYYFIVKQLFELFDYADIVYNLLNLLSAVLNTSLLLIKIHISNNSIKTDTTNNNLTVNSLAEVSYKTFLFLSIILYRPKLFFKKYSLSDVTKCFFDFSISVYVFELTSSLFLITLPFKSISYTNSAVDNTMVSSVTVKAYDREV